jgi:acetyl esterase/lipase
MPEIHCSLNLSYGPNPRHVVDIFVPREPVNKSLLVLIHGGWWSAGHPHDLRLAAMHLAELGWPVAVPGFRQLGEGARNGQDIFDDVRNGIKKAREEISLIGAASHSAILIGSGSGSLIALTASSLLLTDPKAGVMIRAAVACGVTPSLEPWEGCPVALIRTLHSFADGKAAQYSPMSMRADQFPPLLLLHGDNDQDVPARNAQKLHARVIEANEPSTLTILSGVGHSLIENPYDRNGRSAFERIVPFLHEHAVEPERDLFAANLFEV